MTIEDILAGESKNVEFKENLTDKSIKYMKSVVAFANGHTISNLWAETAGCMSVWPEPPVQQTNT